MKLWNSRSLHFNPIQAIPQAHSLTHGHPMTLLCGPRKALYPPDFRVINPCVCVCVCFSRFPDDDCWGCLVIIIRNLRAGPATVLVFKGERPVERKGKSCSKCWSRGSCQPRILCQPKLFFKDPQAIKTFPDKQKLKKFISTRLDLWKKC